MFTPHQIELFYYVAKYEGITAAARFIPYGIGQPAISGQMSEMERRLGAPLFHRKPFKLTEKGAALFAHVRSYHEGLEPVLQRLQGGPAECVSLAAEDALGNHFLSAVTANVTQRMPSVALELRTGSHTEVEACLSDGNAQIVIAATARTIPGVRSVVLAHVIPHLLVARRSAIDAPGHFWRQTRIAERLIYPIEAGVLQYTFERGLRGLRVDWRPELRVDSSAAIWEMVATGQGVGIGLALPDAREHPNVRAIPLTGFDSIPLTLCWKHPVKPMVATVVETIRETARQFWAKPDVAAPR